MRKVNYLAAAVAALGVAIPGAGIASAAASQAADDANQAGQRTETSAERAAERAGDRAESAAERTGSAVQSAAQRTEAGVESAASEAQQAAGRATDRASAQAGGAAPAPELPQGIKAKEADDAEGIRDVIASSTEAALTKGGFDDMVERLVDADRNRIGQNMPERDQLETLDGRIAQIQKAWKEKYDEDFDMNDDDVFARQFIGIAQGEVEDPAAVARTWPVDPTSGSGGAEAAAGRAGQAEVAGSQTGQDINPNPPEVAVKTGETTGAAGSDADDAAQTASEQTPRAREEGGAIGESRIEARNLEEGRDVALVRVPSSHGMPELTVSLIHEKPDMWRIDAPDHVRGQKLYDNLLNQLTQVGESAAQWPADKNDAYRLVSHRVLMAMLDVDANQQTRQSQPGVQGSQQPQQPQSQQ